MEINITAKMCLFFEGYFLNKYELGLLTRYSHYFSDFLKISLLCLSGSAFS